VESASQSAHSIPASSSRSHAQAAQTASHANSHVNADFHGQVNGVSMSVIDEEIDELYQLSAQVKPLEYELNKTREQLQQAYINSAV